MAAAAAATAPRASAARRREQVALATHGYEQFPPEGHREFIGPFVMHKSLSAQAQFRLRQIAGYFTPARLRHLRELSKRRKKHTETPSLRACEWFVINYVKANPLVLATEDGRPFDVYAEYKALLADDKRTLCDPFRRGQRIFYQLPEAPATRWFTTTVGQVRHYKWILTTPIYAYFCKHQEEIFAKMTATCRKRSRELTEERNATGRRPKRRELIKSGVSSVRGFIGSHTPTRVARSRSPTPRPRAARPAANKAPPRAVDVGAGDARERRPGGEDAPAAAALAVAAAGGGAQPH